MMLKFMQSRWIKFVLSAIIVFIMTKEMISGGLTVFWFLIYTLSLAYLFSTIKNIRQAE